MISQNPEFQVTAADFAGMKEFTVDVIECYNVGSKEIFCMFMLLETGMVRKVIQLYLYQGFWIIVENTDGISIEYVERVIKITFDSTDSLFRFVNNYFKHNFMLSSNL